MGWEKKVDKDRNWYSLVEQLEFAAVISEGKAFQDHLPLLETVHVQQTGGGGYSKYRVMMDNTILKVIVSDNVMLIPSHAVCLLMAVIASTYIISRTIRCM